MNRSGYTEELCYDDPLAHGRWRAQVASAIRGKRGQAFLRELAAAMDAMPDKALISGELIDARGGCCAIGVVCKARDVDVGGINYKCPEQVAAAVGIAHQMAAEIEWQNDDGSYSNETPRERWHRMRKWVEQQLVKAKTPQEPT